MPNQFDFAEAALAQGFEDFEVAEQELLRRRCVLALRLATCLLASIRRQLLRWLLQIGVGEVLESSRWRLPAPHLLRSVVQIPPCSRIFLVGGGLVVFELQGALEAAVTVIAMVSPHFLIPSLWTTARTADILLLYASQPRLLDSVRRQRFLS